MNHYNRHHPFDRLKALRLACVETKAKEELVGRLLGMVWTPKCPDVEDKAALENRAAHSNIDFRLVSEKLRTSRKTFGKMAATQ